MSRYYLFRVSVQLLEKVPIINLSSAAVVVVIVVFPALTKADFLVDCVEERRLLNLFICGFSVMVDVVLIDVAADVSQSCCLCGCGVLSSLRV